MRPEPPSLDEVRVELCSRKLRHFLRQAWHVLEPDQPLRWGWAMDAICEHLEAVTDGEITRLLINVPPGFAKSLCSCVFHPAWEWGPRGKATTRVIGSSYSEDYAKRDNRRMRDLVASDWYQARWGDRCKLVRTGELSIENNHRGTRQGIPFQRLTGGRAHRLIIDDPHSTEGAESAAERSRTLRIFQESVPTRLIDPKTSSIVVIMQRLHEEDVSGLILEKELGYEHLMLPMRYEDDHPHQATTCLGFSDPRRVEGELLFPERFPEEVVDRDERILGPHASSGQFQQRPSPRGGGIVKREWFTTRYVKRGEKPLRIVDSWDTASSKRVSASTSARVRLAEFPDRIELWDFFEDRLEQMELEDAIRDHAGAGDTTPTAVLIENKSSGIAACQRLKKTTKLPITPVEPGKLDKDERLRAETPLMAAGQLHFPAEAPWVGPLVDFLCSLPGGRRRDPADALSQGLRWLRENPIKPRRKLSGPLSIGKPSSRVC